MRILRSTLLILALALVVGATPVTFENAGSGVNDGYFYVGPYTLNVGGVFMLAYCTTWTVEVAQAWDATEYEVAGNTAYLEAEWLSLQFVTHPAPADIVAIHHGIWDIFGASYADGLPWAALAADNYPAVDPNSFRVLVPDIRGASQTFLIQDSPEPGTLLLLGIGLVLGGILWRRRRV